MINLQQYRNFSKNPKSNYLTLVIYNKSKDEILSDLKVRMKKLKTMSDKVKRGRIEETFFNLIKYLERSNLTILNKIFLVSGETIESLDIDPLYCKDWSLPDY
jgi:hypothetical protein